MTISQYFISYSKLAQTKAFAITLYNRLLFGPPTIQAWLDEYGLTPGGDWETELDSAIGLCGGLLFVMTPDSVHPKSVCRDELARALRYKKAIVPLLLEPCTPPLRLERRHYIS